MLDNTKAKQEENSEGCRQHICAQPSGPALQNQTRVCSQTRQPVFAERSLCSAVCPAVHAGGFALTNLCGRCCYQYLFR